MHVVREEPVPGLELVQAPSEELGSEAPADESVLAAPTGAALLPVPLVAVQVEDVHRH
jgi:hypothetical protein